MSEKLTESITFKCTYEEKRDLEAIAKSEKKTLSEHMRSLGIANIADVKERLHSLSCLIQLTTDTVETSFELTPEPLIKPAGTKKAQLCDQLSLICHPTQQ